MEFVETSKDYEKLAQAIYKNILILDGVENVEVLHDIKIKGRSGVEHQIDVFWKYKYAGIELVSRKLIAKYRGVTILYIPST